MSDSSDATAKALDIQIQVVADDSQLLDHLVIGNN